jgi:hypothetical protein
MEYVQMLESDKLSAIFELPKSLLGRKVEVVIRPAPDVTINKNESAFGCLRKYANPSLIHEEDGTWEKAVKAKYANN